MSKARQRLDHPSRDHPSLFPLSISRFGLSVRPERKLSRPGNSLRRPRLAECARRSARPHQSEPSAAELLRSIALPANHPTARRLAGMSRVGYRQRLSPKRFRHPPVSGRPRFVILARLVADLDLLSRAPLGFWVLFRGRNGCCRAGRRFFSVDFGDCFERFESHSFFRGFEDAEEV